MEEKIAIVKSWLGSGSVNIFGPQFSGKDTQSLILSEIFDGYKLSSGEILRSHRDKNENLKNEIDDGHLAPTDDFRDIVVPYFYEEKLKDRPLFLSSIGRMKGEEKVVFEATEESNHPTKAVIVLDFPLEEIRHRFEAAKENDDRGMRHDDTEESLLRRLNYYKEHTIPVIDFYRQKDLVVTVDATKSRQNVTDEIINKLHQLATK